MSLASLRRPRLALRYIDRDGLLSITLPSARIAELAQRDGLAHQAWWCASHLAAVARDSLLDDGVELRGGEAVFSRLSGADGEQLRAEWQRHMDAWRSAAHWRPTWSCHPVQPTMRLCRFEGAE